MEKETVMIIDFGGQYSQLIARRVRECGVYSTIVPYHVTTQEIEKVHPKGIILSGGPASVYAPEAPQCDKAVFSLGIPVLGICYGMQLMTFLLGGTVKKANTSEFGVCPVQVTQKSLLWKGLEEKNNFLMSHTDAVEKVPKDFMKMGCTTSCEIAAIENRYHHLYGIQFHPEVSISPKGKQLLENFLFQICHCKGEWKMTSWVEENLQYYQTKMKDKKALLALSGGVDSSVVATLLGKVMHQNLTCIFVDHGFLREKEAEEVEEVMKQQMKINFIRVDAKERFLKRLQGVTEPEQKRKLIGEEFIRVFEEEAQKLGAIDYLVQGTIYPDVIESGVGKSATIKSHHNVGGLPKNIGFQEIIEPLRYLFKDEVRKVGIVLGLPEKLVYRQPFPGPGLAIRMMGEVTEEKLTILRQADAVFREEIENAGWQQKINQYFAVLTNAQSVGVMGDERTYENTIALRAVETSDFMTANWAPLPSNLLEKISKRIVNEVPCVNRVVYDITSKPPATIEWE